MRVVLVTHDSVFGRYVAGSLHGAGKVDQLIIETGRPSWRFYRRKLARVGPINAVFQTLLDRWFQRVGGRELPNLPLPPHLAVASINQFPFADEDLVIGFGTSIISASTLAGVRHGFLNLHTGWLPEYRGVKSEFWTLALGDRARAGWTMHYMTPRLDDGDIVLRRTVKVTNENPAQLRAKLLRDAVPVLGEFVDTVRQHGFASIPRDPQSDGRYFTTPTWRDWRAYRRRAGKAEDPTVRRFR